LPEFRPQNAGNRTSPFDGDIKTVSQFGLAAIYALTNPVAACKFSYAALQKRQIIRAILLASVTAATLQGRHDAIGVNIPSPTWPRSPRGQGSRRNGENENTSTFVRTHSLILGGRERGAVAIVFVAADAAVALMLGSMGMS
jgi:hypothetical protein